MLDTTMACRSFRQILDTKVFIIMCFWFLDLFHVGYHNGMSLFQTNFGYKSFYYNVFLVIICGTLDTKVLIIMCFWLPILDAKVLIIMCFGYYLWNPYRYYCKFAFTLIATLKGSAQC
jgi:hypothetical protein